MNHITAVLTSYNRASLTLTCLGRLAEAANAAGVRLAVILVDDGSTDGTADAVRARHPEVRVISGDGDLFWNRGMNRGMELALADRGTDFILWVNDDTDLIPDALARMLATAAMLRNRTGREAIIVGATADRQTGRLTYSGQNAVSRWRRFTYRKVFDTSEAVACDTMNGNIVLIPIGVARSVGNLDPVFEHAMGDIDYGLRARRLGHPIYVAPGFVGYCSTNSPIGTHADATLLFRVRWQKMVSRKGLPPRSWMQLTRRHGGWLWPLYFGWPYARLLITSRSFRATNHSPK